jgi:hypothetical protein
MIAPSTRWLVKLLMFAVACVSAAAVLAIAILLIGFRIAETDSYKSSHFTSYLPDKIDVDRLAKHGGQSGLADGCGAAIFDLSGATVSAIERQAGGFFSGATQARAHQAIYSEWRAAPIPADVLEDYRVWDALACAGFDDRLQRTISSAILTSGSYFATKHQALLLVAPRQKIAIFLYFG